MTETTRPYQALANFDAPAEMILARHKKQNQRNVAKNRMTAADLRDLHPNDWDRLFDANSEELDKEPIVGDPCQYGNCAGIEGLKGQHRQYCPGEKAAKFKRV